MSTQTASYYEIVSQLPEDASVTFQEVSWEEYLQLVEQIGEAPGLRVTYDNGSLHIMTISGEHEKYAEFIKSLIGIIRLRLRLNILSFGSATMQKHRRSKAHEPDASFYVQTAPLVGNKMQPDFEMEPPDIVVEVDVHHDSRPRFRVYAALGVPEIWRYDGQAMTIYHLAQAETETSAYKERDASVALPMLTAQLLTEMIERMRSEGELQALLAFDEWLQSGK